MLFCIVTFNLWLHFNKLLTYLKQFHCLFLKNTYIHVMYEVKKYNGRTSLCMNNYFYCRIQPEGLLCDESATC